MRKRTLLIIILEDKDGAIEGAGIGAARKSEAELTPLENIVSTFNDVFGNIEWQNKIMLLDKSKNYLNGNEK